MSTRHVRIPLLALTGVVAALGLAACGSSSSAGTASGGSSSHAAGKSVQATETEFHIALPSTSLKAGAYTFRVHNSGKITHAFSIDGPGVSDKSTGSIAPGSTSSLTVTLKAGTYDVFCPIGNHKQMGMDQSVTVS